MKIPNHDGFENLNVYCFDMDQYNLHATHLICTVMVNYEGTIYFQDVKTWVRYYFKWSKHKWILYKDLYEIKYEGIIHIINSIRSEDD